MSRPAPTHIIQQALSRFEEDDGSEPFRPSQQWLGARPGYYFSRGAAGQGCAVVAVAAANGGSRDVQLLTM
jgi:hypothetical protein